MAGGPVHRRYVDVAFGQIHIAEAGAGPTVLCLHQTPRSWDEFREVIEILAADFHLVAVDLPGMGASDPIPGIASIEGYADAALAVVDELGVQQFHVCGHHTGGVVAVELAARAAKRVISLTLSSTPWVDAPARLQRQANPVPVDMSVSVDDGGHLIELWNQRRGFYPPGHALLDRYMIDVLRARDGTEGHQAVGRYEMERAATSVNCPVLVIEHDDDPFSRRHAAEVAQQFQATAFVSITHGAIPLEHSAASVAEAMREFLATF